MKRVGLVLRSRDINGGGGAERRFVRFFQSKKYLCEYKITLIINRSLYQSLIGAGYLDDAFNVKIVEEIPFASSLLFNIELIKSVFIRKEFDVIHLILIQKSLIPFYVICSIYGKFKLRIIGTVASYNMAYRKNMEVMDAIVYCIFNSSLNHVDSLYPNIKTSAKSLSITPCSFTDYNKFSPAKKERIVVFAGRLSSQKNPLMFIQAVVAIYSEVSQVDDSWVFYICGSGPLEAAIKSIINENDLGRVCRVGECNDMPSLLSRSLIFVSLQQEENYPSQALIEAIATKNSLIVTDVGSTRLLVNDSHAYLIPPALNELKKALRDLIFRGGFPEEALNKARSELLRTHNLNIFSDYLLKIWR